MPRKSNLAKSKCALCGAKDISEPRGEERYCRDCWEKKIAIEEIVAREFALKRYIRAHSAEKYLVYHSTIKRPCGQIIVVDDGYDLFLTMVLYPNFAWDEAAYHLEGDPEGKDLPHLICQPVADGNDAVHPGVDPGLFPFDPVYLILSVGRQEKNFMSLEDQGKTKIILKAK